MTRSEIAKLLAAAAARDARTVGEADIEAWYQDVGDLGYADALASVSEHYRDTDRRLMPSHVRVIVGRMKADRREAEPHEIRALPSRYETDQIRDDRVRRGVARVVATLGARHAARLGPLDEHGQPDLSHLTDQERRRWLCLRQTAIDRGQPIPVPVHEPDGMEPLRNATAGMPLPDMEFLMREADRREARKGNPAGGDDAGRS